MLFFVHIEDANNMSMSLTKKKIFINVTDVYIFGDKIVIYNYNFALQFSEFFHYDSRIPCITLVS